MYQEIARNKYKTIVLLMGFIILLAVVGWAVSQLTGQRSMFFFIGIGSLVYALISYFAGAKMALKINGAKEISKKDNPRLWRIVENLSISEGMPMPKVFIMNDPAPNAFATGRNPQHSAVAATTGLLDMMTDSELEGVMAHELGHIKNYDIRVSTIAFALVGIISMVADMFWHMMFWGGGDGDDSAPHPIFYIVAIALIVLAPIAATMLQLAISRKREYLADATGALTTRYPEGLASALEKIGQYGSTMRKPNSSTAHMFFANPLKSKSMMSLFSTHPPVEQRIARLRAMDAEHGK